MNETYLSVMFIAGCVLGLAAGILLSPEEPRKKK